VLLSLVTAVQASADNGRDVSSVLINPRHALAFGAAVVACLLLLQYAHRRKPFILMWAAGWLLIAPAMLLVANTYGNPMVGRLAVGVSQLLGIYTAALFLWSADLFRQTDFLGANRLKLLMVLTAGFLVSAMIFGSATVLVAGYLLAALGLAGAGSMYAAVLIERRMIGAGMVAFVFLGLAISNVSAAFFVRRAGPSSEFLFESLMVNAVLYTFGAFGMHLLVFEDMTYELRMINRRLENAREELLQASITDPLTGCHNRRFLEQVMDRELQRHARFKLPLSLLFIDIDRFKAVNDALGHEAGDRVLQYVSRFLRRHIREADYVFRYGGDEFLVLITCSAAEAQYKAALLKTTFDAAPEAADLPPGIGLSVGWIGVPEGTTDLTPLIHEADRRMYADKAGR
jgi:diguanylate cyclase (GGDEF)-like protein